MKIPKTLKIGGHTVTVDCSKELENRSGEWLSDSNTIRICKTLPPSQQEATIIHEILHAINSEWDTTQVGHILLESISQQLYQVLADNKLLK